MCLSVAVTGATVARQCPTVINPCIPERGIAELEWLLGRGARVVLLRPAPAAGYRGTRSPFLEEFDPFWARVAESGVLVILHASDSGYQRHVNDWEGSSRSDYPHPEGMADPLGWAKEIDELFPAADVQKIMGANMYQLLGLA
jgi:hypothetical protein